MIIVPLRTGSAVRVELSSLVVCSDVDLCKVTCTGDLNVGVCLDPVDRSEGACWDHASTVVLSAPSDFVLFGDGDLCVGLGWCPQAEVFGRVDKDCLTHGVLGRLSLFADVGSLLTLFAGLGQVVVLEGVELGVVLLDGIEPPVVLNDGSRSIWAEVGRILLAIDGGPLCRGCRLGLVGCPANEAVFGEGSGHGRDSEEGRSSDAAGEEHGGEWVR